MLLPYNVSGFISFDENMPWNMAYLSPPVIASHIPKKQTWNNQDLFGKKKPRSTNSWFSLEHKKNRLTMMDDERPRA